MALAERHLPAPIRHVERKRPPGLLANIARHWADYLYVLPALLVMLVVIGYPLVSTIFLSFHEITTRNERVFTGLDNFRQILTDPQVRFWQITANTLYWTIGSTLFAFLIGFGAALVLHRDFRGRGVIRALLLIPWVISHVAAAYVFRWILHSDYGLLSGSLIEWGIIDRPLVLLDSKQWVMPSVIGVNVWKEFPFVMIMLTAGLQTIPEGLLRAARIDGASAWQSFWHVTVPHLKSVIVVTMLLLFVINLNSFTLVWLMTGGGPANSSALWITQIFKLAFVGTPQRGLASAFSVILFLLMLSLAYYYVKALTGGSKERRAA
ncbi:MAG TPA: sugar ABC transporter permease [Thermomicrobiales bacterium]|nr:sugar ABC transporter permease [Thermomicrobiales bacterium]